MAIQVRRGNESDFDASKMLPGEWAVSLDTKYVRMCFAPGVVLRMATYEGFENDKAQFQAILAECRSIQSAVQRIQSEVNAKASLTVEYSNGAKESADRAYSEAERAKIYADNAEAVTGVQIATKERAGLIKGGDNYIAEDGTLMLITTTTSTTQPNSYAGRENILEIGGVTEQDSTAGNQLIETPYSTGSKTVNGIAFTVNDDGTIKAKGTSTGIADFILKGGTGASAPILFDSGTRLIGCPSGGGTSTYFLRASDNVNYAFTDFGEGVNITEGIRQIYIRVLSGVTVDVTFKPMVTTDLTATYDDYEPYTGGIPAPNPSYPMPIKKTVVSGVKTHGKNFWTFGDIKIGASTNLNWNIPAGAYTFSCSNSAPALLIRVFYTDESNELISLDKSVTTFTLKKDVYKFNFSTSSAGDITNIQVEEGTVATNYEPYTSSEYTFSQPIELYGIGDVQDVIENGAIKRKYKKIILDGSDDEKWGFAGSSANPLTFCCEISDAKRSLTTQNGLCDTYTFVEKNFALLDDNECTMYQDYGNNYPNSNWIYIRDTSCETVMELKTRLQSAPITVVYELATLTTEALPIADQIGLNSLQTYDGITYVEFDSEIQPTFKAEYGTSKVGGYTLESLLTARNNELKQNMVNERLSALEASVVNNI